ncbi:MAG: aspartate/glutamate racemase family protein [Anaerolineales bacterium]|nr:aspartate/glutamate racemase family protein [Anaerolineales bacterium]MCS7248607.1 aspartate/glutamate racemase family protein [Anaerolineales bacterium]MDW8162420.1 aspartate/glutamate racemase family protein [Anaerolineales bacterium]MDW8446280.1 aspartate/glutamate racemase family protein [Anaerolineales bacterium]
MRILWINPVGTTAFDADTTRMLSEVKRAETTVKVVSLPSNRPRHLEYHAYEAQVVADIVRITYAASQSYDAIVIGCFYDVGLREAREVSGQAVVLAPCHSATTIAANLGNSFSILVGRKKWIPKMRENVILYGHEHRLASMRPVDLGVHDFQADPERTCQRLIQEGRRAVEEDGAEVLILGCTAEYGFYQEMQDVLGVPVIDAVLAPFKMAEFMVELGKRIGWHPSRKGGSEPPPGSEIESWRVFEPLPVEAQVLEL